jgi:hypothetical protein
MTNKWNDFKPNSQTEVIDEEEPVEAVSEEKP